jgi:hypothetical protein
MRRLRARPTSTVMVARRLLVVLASALVVVATGCGGGEQSSSSAEPISFEQLAQSASTSADAVSGRFSFDLSVSFPGGDEPFALSGEGAFDKPSNRASFAVDMSSFAQLLGGFFAGLAGQGAKGMPDFEDPAGWKIEVVQDGEVGYVRFPAFDEQLPAGKSWIRAEKGEKAGGFELEELEQFAKTDPRELLEALQAVTSDVEAVGTESLRGTEVTHYRAVIDPEDLATKVPEDEREQTRSLVDEITSQSGIGEIPVDVWIDATGLVRKLSMTASATDPGTSQSSDLSMSFEIWDYDEPVDIELPPASEVVDASAVRG